MSLPPGVFVDTDQYHQKRRRHVQILANHFWKRWLREFLLALQERSNWNQKRRNAALGDLVLVAADDVARGNWPLAFGLCTVTCAVCVCLPAMCTRIDP